MKLNKNICVKASESGAIALNYSTGEYLRLNSTGFVVFSELETSKHQCFEPDDIAAILVDRWSLDKSFATRESEKIIAVFKEMGLVDD